VLIIVIIFLFSFYIYIYIFFFCLSGKRRCPGEALARSAIFLLFVGVMQKYRLLPEPGKESIKMELTSGLILALKPYEMLILPR